MVSKTMATMEFPSQVVKHQKASANSQSKPSCPGLYAESIYEARGPGRTGLEEFDVKDTHILLFLGPIDLVSY